MNVFYERYIDFFGQGFAVYIRSMRIRLLKTTCEWHVRRKCQVTSSYANYKLSFVLLLPIPAATLYVKRRKLFIFTHSSLLYSKLTHH